jgi:DNA-binding NtrC family response regulator
MKAIERRRIVEALERSGGNQTKAAELLGMSRRTLVAKLGEHDLPRPRKRDG